MNCSPLLLCPLLSPRVWSNSCLLSRLGRLTISCFAAPFSVCLQPFPESGSFPKSQLFASGDRSIRASASALPMHIQGWFPLGLTGLISSPSKGLPNVFPRSTIQKRQSSVLTITEIAGPSPRVSDSICYGLGSEKMCISSKFPRDADNAGLGIILGELHTMYFSMKFCIILLFFSHSNQSILSTNCVQELLPPGVVIISYISRALFLCMIFLNHISRQSLIFFNWLVWTNAVDSYYLIFT